MAVESLPNNYPMTLIFLLLRLNNGSLRCFSNLHEDKNFLSDLLSVTISRPHPGQGSAAAGCLPPSPPDMIRTMPALGPSVLLAVEMRPQTQTLL